MKEIYQKLVEAITPESFENAADNFIDSFQKELKEVGAKITEIEMINTENFFISGLFEHGENKFVFYLGGAKRNFKSLFYYPLHKINGEFYAPLIEIPYNVRLKEGLVKKLKLKEAKKTPLIKLIEIQYGLN